MIIHIHIIHIMSANFTYSQITLPAGELHINVSIVCHKVSKQGMFPPHFQIVELQEDGTIFVPIGHRH